MTEDSRPKFHEIDFEKLLPDPFKNFITKVSAPDVAEGGATKRWFVMHHPECPRIVAYQNLDRVDGIDPTDGSKLVCTPCIRADLHDDLVKAADELAEAVARGECPWRDDTSEYREWHKIAQAALTAYNEAREKLK